MRANEITKLIGRILTKEASEEELEEMNSISKLDPQAGYQFRQIEKFWKYGQPVSSRDIEEALEKNLAEIENENTPSEKIAHKKSPRKFYGGYILIAVAITALIFFLRR